MKKAPKKRIAAAAHEETKPVDDGMKLDPRAGTGISKKSEEEQAAEALKPVDDLNEEINANWKLAHDAAQEWLKEAKEDVEFKSGKQWSDADRAKLEGQGRPCLTFNKIKAIVKLLTGHFIQNSNRINVAPEGGEDEKFSGMADKIMDHLDEQASLEFNLGYQFAGGQTTGRSYLELYIDYEKDPIFGELKSIYHGKPGIIYPDPRGSSYDLNEDRQFCFKVVKKTKAELRVMYPAKLDEISEICSDTEDPTNGNPTTEGDANNYGAAKNRSKQGIKKQPIADPTDHDELRQFHVKEYWRLKYNDKICVYFVDSGAIVKFDTDALAEAEIQKRHDAFITAGGQEADWKTIKRTRKVKEMNVAIRCGGVVLADGKSPAEPYYSGFLFFQYIADWTPEAEKDVDAHQGIVRSLKDPQREKNKARSSFLHILSTAANSGWIVDEDAMTKDKISELKNFGSTPGIVVTKKTGKEVRQIEPPGIPMAQVMREKAAGDDFKEVSGVNADLLAMDESANPSGKAIALRIRQAITILEPDFRNFRRTKKLIGTAIMQLCPTLFDSAKVKKVLGAKYLEENKIDETFIKAFLIQIEDLRYLVRIAEQGDTKTLREETFEDLMQMLEKGVQLPFELLANFMNFPNKQEVLNQVKGFQEQQRADAIAAAQAKNGGPSAAK